MFGFGKKKTPQWNDLTEKQRLQVTGRIAKAVKAMSGPRYKLVSGTNVWQRDRGFSEHRDEDEILNTFGRGAMLD